MSTAAYRVLLKVLRSVALNDFLKKKKLIYRNYYKFRGPLDQSVLGTDYFGTSSAGDRIICFRAYAYGFK